MQQIVRFGDYEFDVDGGQLMLDTRELRLTPKATALLQTLLSRAGQLVTKQELFAAVWKGTIVSDDALASCVQELRCALHDDSKKPRYIQTRHRSGYRFIAPLVRVTDGPLAPVPTVASSISTIAVLPFADMSPAHDQDYLCEGLAEELINVLTRLDRLRVASRTASFQFRNAGADVCEIGRRLNVDTLLEGSVRKTGAQLRVTVQLIDVATGYHRWSERFDRQLEDVFAIQDEIAESVAKVLRGRVLSGQERRALLRPETDSAAYEYYLRGRQHLHRLTQPELQKSAALFERAIQLDANYAPAHAGLATVHATLHEWFGAGEEALLKAEHASLRALELSPGLAETHVARGLVFSLSRRYDDARREFEEAIHINPNLFDAYYYFGRAAFGNGQLARSAELFGLAAQVRLEDHQSLELQAQSLTWLNRGEEAIVAAREAIRRAERALQLNPDDIRALSMGAHSLLRAGQHARSAEWIQRALELDPEDMGATLNAVCLYAKTGQKERALELLERAASRGWGRRDWIENDRDYDSLREDERFKKLIARLR
jgi:adenylate cyclase